MKTSNTTTLSKNEIFVNEIVFFCKEEASLYGFINHNDTFQETHYIITRKHLQTLLSQNKVGVEILWQIENLFLLPHQAPATLNLIDLYGTTQIFEASDIQLQKSMTEYEMEKIPALREQQVLFIQEVIPFGAGIASRI